MKKNIILIFTTFLYTISVAQSLNPTFGFGGRAGLNISQFNDNFGGGSSAYGANVAGIGVMNFGKYGYTSLIGELVFNQKGGTNRASGENRIYNIDIPVLFRFTKSIKENIPVKLFFNAGPYAGFMLARNVKPDSNSYAQDFKENFVEAGLCLGAGFIYPLGPGSVFLEGKYAFSISNVVQNSYERNRLTSISIGYIYQLAGKTQEQKDKKIDGGFE